MFGSVWAFHYVYILDGMIPALGKLKQEGHTFEAQGGPYLKKQNIKTPPFLNRPLSYTPAEMLVSVRFQPKESWMWQLTPRSHNSQD